MSLKKLPLAALALAAVLAGGAVKIVQDQCGPFTDVTPAFCPFVLELYYLGITAGTSATTFSPDDPLTRGQAAVFVAKGLNQSLARSSRRAALGQWWTPSTEQSLGMTSLPGPGLGLLASDGADVWVGQGDVVQRVRASDGRLLQTWTAALGATGVRPAIGRIIVTGNGGAVYLIDPSQPVGDVATVATGAGAGNGPIVYDGSRFWTTSYSTGSISIITPTSPPPWTVTTLTTGFSFPNGILYDGSNIWITDTAANTLLRLDSTGLVIQTVAVGMRPGAPAFDGANIWVPNNDSGSISVVNAATGAVLQTLTGNGLSHPGTAASDGLRVLISDVGLVSVWNAADLKPIESLPMNFPDQPDAFCSDGINFWIAINPGAKLARF